LYKIVSSFDSFVHSWQFVRIHLQEVALMKGYRYSCQQKND